jgi:hypothetical protein
VNYSLGNTHIAIDVKHIQQSQFGDECWLCTAYIGNAIALQLETPYNGGDIHLHIEHEFCRMVALELSKSIGLLLTCQEDENE